EWNLMHPSETPRVPYVTNKLKEAEGPFVAVSDYMRAVPNQIVKWVPGAFHALGTDGFGFADTRPAARRFFNVDAESVVVQALAAVAERGELKPEVVQEAFDRYRIDDPTAVRGRKQEGGDA
ncbi:MAG: transketolase-like TK C-terminal-containing protein, partial [Nocardioides sp.]